VDLAHGHGDGRLLTPLRSATIHLWYALHSSDDTAVRLDAAEDQLTAAIEHADGEIGATIRRVLAQVRAQRSGGGV
jgi:hypothetical protein